MAKLIRIGEFEAASDDTTEYLMRNPESKTNGAMVEVTSAAVAAQPRLEHVVMETINDLGWPRPNVVGRVHWYIRIGSGLPINAIPGDLVTEVAADPAPWTPLDHPYLKAWWDPSTISVADNDPIEAWVERSTNSWQLAQVSAGLRPTLDLDGINGRRGVRFGGGKMLRTGTLPVQNRQPLTTYAVIAGGPAVVSGGSDFFMDRLLGATSVGGAAGRSSANKWTFVNGATTTSAVDSDAAPRIFKIVEASDATTIYVNGAQVATTAPTTGRLTFDMIVLGARGDGLNPWEGLLGDIALFAAPVLGATDGLMMEYLTTKYGL